MSFFRGIKGIFIDNIFDQAFEKIILNLQDACDQNAIEKIKLALAGNDP